MDPDPTLAEIARLLHPGGVFAAYNHDFYPVLSVWEAESAYWDFRERAIALDDERQITAQTGRWPKA